MACTCTSMFYRNVMIFKFPDFNGGTCAKNSWCLTNPTNHTVLRNEIEMCGVVVPILFTKHAINHVAFITAFTLLQSSLRVLGIPLCLYLLANLFLEYGN